jgi:hypothetical protein
MLADFDPIILEEGGFKNGKISRNIDEDDDDIFL